MLKKNKQSSLVDLIWVKAKLNLKSEAVRNKLSYIWWVLEPLLYLLVFYVVFTYVLIRGTGEDFVISLLVGLIPFHWFNKAVSGSAGSILNGKGLLQQVAISPVFFPAVSVIQSSLKQIPVFIVLLVFLFALGHYPTLAWFAILPLLLLQLALIASLAILLALIVPFIKDLLIIIPTGMTLLLFVSGIFFDLSTLPPDVHQWFLLNPLANLIEQYRSILIHGEWPDFFKLIQLLITVMVFSILAVWLYSKLHSLYAKVVME